MGFEITGGAGGSSNVGGQCTITGGRGGRTPTLQEEVLRVIAEVASGLCIPRRFLQPDPDDADPCTIVSEPTKGGDS